MAIAVASFSAFPGRFATGFWEALRAQRSDAYYGIDGLRTKFSGMKQSIKGQYTPPSTQWTQVKGLSW